MYTPHLHRAPDPAALRALTCITPGRYPGKAAHGQVVPTWNSTVAHGCGTARLVDDRTALLGLLHRLTDANEAAQPKPWRVDDAPPEYIDRLLAHTVGIEILVDRLEGKFRLSQDEALEDRIGTVRGLQACPGQARADMAALVSRAIDAESRAPDASAAPRSG